LSKRRRVLVVEDDNDIREGLEGALTERYDVLVAEHGRAALDLLASRQPVDVILLDLMMPVLNGWQFRVAQRADPAIADIPVIVVSADASAQAAAIDAARYLRKPIKLDALFGAIEETLALVDRRRRMVDWSRADRLASLGTLAAGIAHEINNPLTVVMSCLSHLTKHAEADTRELATEALQGARRIRDIVADMRMFARTDDDRLPALPADVHRVLEAALHLTDAEIRARARLVKDLSPVPPVAVSELRLGQVFINLLTNATQAFEGGAPDENSLTVATRTSPEGKAIVEITDSGRGIPAELLGRVFDPFFTLKRGSGLGLSIVHGIVTSVGGDIAVLSEPGRGTTFRVTFPPAPDEEAPGGP
jgi:two-component system, cell cycle sensor histidine kinase and response regulator CckA